MGFSFGVAVQRLKQLQHACVNKVYLACAGGSQVGVAVDDELGEQHDVQADADQDRGNGAQDEV